MSLNKSQWRDMIVKQIIKRVYVIKHDIVMHYIWEVYSPVTQRTVVYTKKTTKEGCPNFSSLNSVLWLAFSIPVLLFSLKTDNRQRKWIVHQWNQGENYYSLLSNIMTFWIIWSRQTCPIYLRKTFSSPTIGNSTDTASRNPTALAMT